MWLQECREPRCFGDVNVAPNRSWQPYWLRRLAAEAEQARRQFAAGELDSVAIDKAKLLYTLNRHGEYGYSTE